MSALGTAPAQHSGGSVNWVERQKRQTVSDGSSLSRFFLSYNNTHFMPSTRLCREHILQSVHTSFLHIYIFSPCILGWSMLSRLWLRVFVFRQLCQSHHRVLLTTHPGLFIYLWVILGNQSAETIIIFIYPTYSFHTAITLVKLSMLSCVLSECERSK